MKTPQYNLGDNCPSCQGTGTRWLHEDAHRSGGVIPCGYSTTVTRWMGPRGAFYDQKRKGTKPVKCMGLRCNKGKLA